MKKLLLIIILIIIVLYRPMGDLNGDYKVSITDLVIMDRITLGMDHTLLQRFRADLNNDGVVDELDLNILHCYILNK